MRFWRNLLGSVILTGSLLFPSVSNAQPKEVRIPREIRIDFADPEKNFEANSNDWYTLDQIIGKETEVLYKNWNNSFGTRLLALSADHYFTHFFKFASHELGHNRELKRYGDASTSFELNNPFNLNKDYIRTKKYRSTLEQQINATIAGLNHDEYNSYMTFRNNLDIISVHDAWSFLINKWYDVGYILKGTPAEEGGDPENYILMLNEQNIPVSKRDYLIQAFIADFFSIQTADCMETVHHYLSDGQLTKKPTRIYFGDITVTPPLISHYLTSKGGVYNITSIIGATGRTPIELSFATPINFLGGGEVSNYRAGIQVNNIRMEGLKLSPFYYFDTNLSSKQTGYSAGLQINKSLRKNVELRFKVEHNQNDLMENIVKGEENGWNFVVGVDVRF